MVAFVLHILPVHLHHPVSRSQPAQVRRGAGLHFADELSSFIPLPVQVEPIPALSFGQETESGSQLALHPSHANRGGKQVKVSQENKQVFVPGAVESLWLLIQRPAAARSTDQKIIII